MKNIYLQIVFIIYFSVVALEWFAYYVMEKSVISKLIFQCSIFNFYPWAELRMKSSFAVW